MPLELAVQIQLWPDGYEPKLYQDGNRFKFNYYQCHSVAILYHTYSLRSVEEEKKLISYVPV